MSDQSNNGKFSVIILFYKTHLSVFDFLLFLRCPLNGFMFGRKDIDFLQAVVNPHQVVCYLRDDALISYPGYDYLAIGLGHTCEYM